MARLALGLSVLLACAAGCRLRPFHENGSTVRHTAQALLGPQGGVWVQVDEKPFLAFLQNFVLFAELRPVEAGEARVRNLQAQVDKIHAYWLSRADARAAAIPRPEVVVIRSDAENAFTETMWVCMENRNSTEPDSLTMYNAKSAVLKIMDAGGGEFCAASLADPQIARGVFDAMGSFIAESDGTKSLCRPEHGSNPPRFAGECASSPGLSSRYWAFPAAANKVVMSSRLLEVLKDEELAYILAHELAHYYRSHTVTPKHLSDFFYKEMEERKGKPSPSEEPRILALQREMLALSEQVWLRDFGDSFLSRSGLKEIFFKRVHFGERGTASLDSLLQTATPSEACQSYKAFVKDKGKLGALQKSSALSLEERDDFREGESAVFSCLDELSLQNREAAQKVKSFLTESCSRLACRMSPSASAREAFEALNASLRTKARRYEALVQEGMAAGLSWYTAEQEADDYALEMMNAALGISPVMAFPAVTRMVKTDPDTLDNLRPEECRRAYERGFRNAQGAWVPMPFGPLADDHHGACYRLYNLAREIATHGWEQSSRLPDWNP